MSFITRAYGASKLALKAKAPTIMVVSGVVAMGASVVLASKQTLKVEEVLAKHEPNLEKIQKGMDLDLPSYTKETAQTDRFRVYGSAGVDLVKLYALPGTLFIGGAVLVFGGHRLMLKRNASLALAFTGLKKTFDAYRQRVIDHGGHQADQEYMHGFVEREVVDPETGKVEMVSSRDWDKSRHDPYNRVFEQGASTEWKPDLGVNKMFLQHQQKLAQQLLNLRGHLYLNEVYHALGFPETDIGQVVGWKTKRLPDGSKDIPFVDFGLDKPLPDDWKYNRDKAVFLDFNCQGLIVGGDIQKILEKA